MAIILATFSSIAVADCPLDRLSAGDANTCGIRSDGWVQCWGFNDNSQSMPPGGVFTSVATGNRFACGIRGDGSIECWGRDDIEATSPPPGQFTTIRAGRVYDHPYACALRTDGRIQCWGDNSDGQASPPDGSFMSVSAEERHCPFRKPHPTRLHAATRS